MTTGSSKKVNISMVTLARESRQKTQSELAENLGITQGNLSKIEQGLIIDVSDELVNKLSYVLNYPKSFFYQEGEIYQPTLLYRRRVQVPKKLLYKTEADINIYKLNIERFLRLADIPECAIPYHDVELEGEPKFIAKIFRQELRIPRGPIKNLTKIIENLGVIIIKYDFQSSKIDGLSIYTDYKNPIIFINSAFPSDRQRFTLAHELGHHVMHMNSNISSERDIEKEANQFASELLVPENEYSYQIEGYLDLPKLADLKRYWKVSMQMLLYKANECGIITENQYRHLWYKFGKYKKREPFELDFPEEETSLIDELINVFKDELNYSDKEIAKLIHLDELEYYKKFIKNKSFLKVV